MAARIFPTDRPQTPDGSPAPEPPPWHVTLFSHGFRPFFLGAGLYAALALAAWTAWIAIHAAGGAPLFMTIAEPPHLWHAHEMVFGYGAAAVAGFLLTAVPNWTGTARLQSGPLAVIFALWLIGRAAMWATAALPAIVAATADLIFLPVLALLLTRKFGANLRPANLVFIGLVAVLAGANVIFHLERLAGLESAMQLGATLGLGTLLIMITMIGGRVIPGFTKNALTRQGIEDRLPVRHAKLDAASILTVVLFVVLYAGDMPDPLVGATALAAALANGARLALWRTAATLKQPILWVLHLGYGWLVFGMALMAEALLIGLTNPIAALHALSTGVIGTMTLAIMSRAALGHSGRKLVAPRPVVASYLLVSVAAVLRAIGPTILPSFYNELMLAASAAWITAFALFTIVYAPILTTPRQQA